MNYDIKKSFNKFIKFSILDVEWLLSAEILQLCGIPDALLR